MVMTDRPSDPAPANRGGVVAGGLVLGLLALLAVGLVALVLLARDGALSGTAAEATPDPSDFAYAETGPAPALELTDQDGQPFALSSLQGRPALVFFGYTHCPDVCPATVGVVSEALADVEAGPRAVFVSIDPERDDVAAMKSYLRYLPAAFTGLSGAPADVRANADRWGVKYARIDQDSAGGYAMAHTADIFLVDAQGQLRARFPFGTDAAAIVASLEALLAKGPAPSGGVPVAVTSPVPVTPAPVSPGPVSSADPIARSLVTEVVSTSIWSGGQSPVILQVADDTGVRLDGTTPLIVQVTASDGSPQGAPVTAVAVRPEGASETSFVATLDFPAAGAWGLQLVAGDARGTATIQALDPGSTASLGAPAPDIATPTLDDVGGVVRAVTTQPNPDLRMSKTSTAEARAAGKPYVLVVDSERFKVSPACGRALTMIRFLLDRWQEAAFIHLEPFEYQVITEEPVLSGALEDPPLNRYSRAWGLGEGIWPGTEMPWIFVVDGEGIVRAKYTGIAGSADIDVILSLISGNGVIAG